MRDNLDGSVFTGKDLSSTSSQAIAEADILITTALASRPTRPPDLATENQALRTLSQHLLDEPQSRLKSLVDMALELFGVDTVGVSLLETTPSGTSVCRWVAIAGSLAHLEQTLIPSEFSPCGSTLACQSPQLYAYPERYFTYLYKLQFPIVEALLMPLYVKDQPLGTLWMMSHHEGRQFDAEDQRLMTSLRDFAVSALYSMQQLHQMTTEALCHSGGLNQQILNSSDDSIKVLDLKGRILFISQEGQMLLGIQDISRFLNQPWVEFWQGTNQQAAMRAIAKAKAGEVYTFQGYRPTLTGEPKWWNCKVSPIRGVAGQVELLLCISRDITERKLSQEKLRESQERYRAIVNQAVTGVAWSQLDGLLTLVNQKYCDITGYSAAELSRMQMQEITHPEDLPRNLELYNRMLKEGTPFEIEKRYIRKDGSIVWVNNHVSVICDHQGKPQSIVAIVLDITERKKAQEALREAQESLTIAVEAAQMGTWYLDLSKDDATKRSLRHDQIFGDDTLQTRWGQEIAKRHVVEEDQEIFDAAFTRAMETGELNFEARIQWSDGSIHWMAARGRFYSDENGKLIYGAGVNFDITHNKLIEAQLRASEAKYRSLFESMDEGFCILQLIFDAEDKPIDYRYIEINPVFEKQTGMKNALGRTIRELVPDIEPFWFDIYGKVALTGESKRFVDHAESMGRWFDVYAFRIGEPYERKVAVLFNDITERKHSEAQREQLLAAEQQARAAAEAAREEAQAANRVKDEFLAVLSHELRSPLNPILGWSTLLQNNKLDAAKTAQALAIIQRNARLQSQLIEDLLDVSRILQGKLNLNVVPLNLESVIKAAIETVRLATEAKAIKLEANLEPSHSQVLADSTRLQQVIWNLLSNAVKFTDVGGQVNIHLKYADSSAYITVSDNGQGIVPEFLPHVFDYFRQADGATTRKFGGLGLGLAIVRHLVELHGGTVAAESLGLGMGATFTVRLPLIPTQATDNYNTQSSELAGNLHGIQVLVVDDETDSREFVAFVLEQAGANVITAATAQEAITKLIHSQPDVLLSDIGMPGVDGYMLMQQVRALPSDQGGQVKAIALTAYAGDFNQQKALQAGFQHHLSKPVEPEVLVKAITSLYKRL